MLSRTLSDRAIASAIYGFALLLAFAGTMYAPRLVEKNAALVLLSLGACGAIGGLIFLILAVVHGWRAVHALPQGAITNFLWAARLPIGLAVANAVLWSALSTGQVWFEAVFNCVRVVAVMWAGYIVARRGFSLLKCAALGLFLLFLDHVVIGGGHFLLAGEWMAFAGVLVSFGMFAFVSLALGAAGGAIGKRAATVSSASGRA